MSIATKKSDTTPERYVHVKVDHPMVSHVTVFARKIDEHWFASAAMCSKKDQFVRKMGRNMARRRFFTQGPMARLKGGMAFSYEAAASLVKTILPQPQLSK